MLPTQASEVSRVAPGATSEHSQREPEGQAASQMVFARLMLPRGVVPAGIAAAGAEPAEASEPPRLSSAVLQQLVRAVRASVRNGGQRVEVKLGLRELGGLRLKLEFQGQRVSLWATVPDQKVARLLLNSRHELAQRLARWGLELGGLQASEESFDDGKENAEAEADPSLSGPPSSQPAAAATPARRSFIEVVI